MIASMTGYGRSATQQEWGQAIWELRSVNHRYLDLSFKMPDNFREWEQEWRSLANNYIHRGKVECHLTFIPSEQSAPILQLNTSLVQALLKASHSLSAYKEITPKIKPMELLRWPDVLIVSRGDTSALKAPLGALLEAALAEISQNRQREGKQLQHFLRIKLTQVLEQVTMIKERLPLCIKLQKEKLLQKLNDLQTSFEEARLEQEMLYFVQRIDVEEEVERLATHTKEVEHTLNGKGAVGRRLDFLMQEMNREANTVGAKAQDKEITKAAISLKVMIEQMREQIQNVE